MHLHLTPLMLLLAPSSALLQVHTRLAKAILHKAKVDAMQQREALLAQAELLFRGGGRHRRRARGSSAARQWQSRPSLRGSRRRRPRRPRRRRCGDCSAAASCASSTSRATRRRRRRSTWGARSRYWTRCTCSRGAAARAAPTASPWAMGSRRSRCGATTARAASSSRSSARSTRARSRT